MKRYLMLMLVCCMAAFAAAQSSNDSMKNTKGDKTIMGCVRSNNGMYMLEQSNGKMAMISGSDLSQHVGHTVALHGMWQKSDSAMAGGMNNSSGSGNNSSMSGSSSGSSSDSGMNNSSMNNSSSGNSGMNSSSGSSMSSDDMKKMKWNHKGESFMVNNVDMKSSSCDMPMKNK